MVGFMLAAVFLPLACEAARVRVGVQFLARQLSEEAGTPSIVAAKFLDIENDWYAQVRLSMECEAKSSGACQSPPPLFQQSCGAVATTFAQRGGDRAGVQSFMTSVCGANILPAKSSSQCQIFAKSLEDELGNGQAADGINTNVICQQFWTQLMQIARAEQPHKEADGVAAAAAVAKAAAATPPVPKQEQQPTKATVQLNAFHGDLGAGQAEKLAAAAKSHEVATADAKDGESSDEADDSEEDDGEDQSDQNSDDKEDAEDKDA